VKVLATRALPGPAWAELDDVEILDPRPIGAVRPGVEALIVVNEPVGELLDRLPDLRLVASFGAGYDRIDVAECTRRGVAVTNTPGAVDAATADLAFALILAARRRFVEGDRLVRAGRWVDTWAEGPFLGREVSGATLGIVGLGRVGAAVARRAAGFEMPVLYTQRHPVETPLGEYRGLDDLLRASDVVSLHVPLAAATRGLLSRERLALLRDGATLVNTARGGVVDEDALVDDLVSGRITAGLDVFAHEPRVPEVLLSLPNVVLSPHLGTATAETRGAMTRVVVDNVLALERGEPLLTPVSP
jgi:glyoxylate reductase